MVRDGEREIGGDSHQASQAVGHPHGSVVFAFLQTYSRDFGTEEQKDHLSDALIEQHEVTRSGRMCD